MSIHIITPISVTKAFISPLLLAITRAAQLCTTQSARELMQSSAELWDIVDAYQIDGSEESSEDLEEVWVDMTKVFAEVQLEVARMCALVDAEEDSDMEKAWTFLLTGFRLFDAAVIAYVRREHDELVSKAAAFDEFQGLFANHPSPSSTLH